MSDRSWLVSVCAGRWQLPVIDAARREGVAVLGVDGDPHADAGATVDRFVIADVRDPAAVVDAVRASGIEPAGVVCYVAEVGQRSAAAVRDEFGLPGPTPAVAHRLTDKAAQRAAWTDAGLPCPQWIVADSPAEVIDAVTALGGDTIVKPVDAAGSRGITRLGPGDDPARAADHALAASSAGRAIVERFVVGTEFTVETFSHGATTEVLAVTVKEKVPGSGGTVAMELATPDLPTTEVDRIGRLAADALGVLGHDCGAGHTEILRGDDGTLTLVEAAGRGGGFMVAEALVPRASGFDLAAATMRQAIGRPLGTEARPRRAVVLRFLPSSPGIVQGFAGFDAVAAMDGVEAGPLVAIGQHVRSATTDGDRLAYVLSWGVDIAEARRRADAATALLRVDLEHDPCG